MSAGKKLEEAERVARRGTSALTLMIVKKRIPGQTLQGALSDLQEACSIIELVLPPSTGGDTLGTSKQGDGDDGSTD